MKGPLGHFVDNTREFKSVNYINLIAMLIDSVQELDKRSSKDRLNEVIKITKGLSKKVPEGLENLESEISDIADSIKYYKIALEKDPNLRTSLRALEELEEK